MCLNIHWWNRRPHVANKDIVVYKMLQVGWRESKWMTPHQRADVNIGETYTSEIQRLYGSYNRQWRIDRGLHSLTRLSTAIKLARSHGYKVVECVIPKGSLYYKGKWETTEMGKVRGYASSAITYVKMLPDG